MNSDKDIELVKLCQSGDVTAFDGLVRRHQDRIYRLVYKMLGGAYEADDVSQDVFLKAYRSIKDFRCQSSFSTWLTQITINQCINHLKNRNRFKFLSFGLSSKRRSVEPQIVAERNEKREKVYQVVNSLPIKQKTVIILHYFENYSCEEIAEVLKCSIGTVKSRLYYARMELKEKLKPFLDNSEWAENSSEVSI
jgi:RNA polymerase sigma-70 factor (ECF subfamily)